MRSSVVFPEPDGPEEDQELAFAALQVDADDRARLTLAEDLGQALGSATIAI